MEEEFLDDPVIPEVDDLEEDMLAGSEEDEEEVPTSLLTINIEGGGNGD